MAQLITQTKSTGASPKYRVWHAYNIPCHMDYYAVAGVEEAKSLIRQLTQRDLMNPGVQSNSVGLEELEDGEYLEWYSGDDDILAVMDAEEARDATATAKKQQP